jgi:hypothetical protein
VDIPIGYHASPEKCTRINSTHWRLRAMDINKCARRVSSPGGHAHWLPCVTQKVHADQFGPLALARHGIQKCTRRVSSFGGHAHWLPCATQKVHANRFAPLALARHGIQNVRGACRRLVGIPIGYHASPKKCTRINSTHWRLRAMDIKRRTRRVSSPGGHAHWLPCVTQKVHATQFHALALARHGMQKCTRRVSSLGGHTHWLPCVT